MTARVTTAVLAERVEGLTTAVASIVGLLQSGQAAQFSTPVAVLDAPAPAPVAPVTASDTLRTFVEAKGLHFAKGGRTHLTTEALAAAVRVLKTGTPEILSVTGVGNLDKRNVTHIAIGRADDGKSVITQYVYSTPAS